MKIHFQRENLPGMKLVELSQDLEMLQQIPCIGLKVIYLKSQDMFQTQLIENRYLILKKDSFQNKKCHHKILEQWVMEI